MTMDGMILGIVAALLVGASLAWCATSILSGRRFEQRIREIEDAHRLRQEAAVEKLDAAHALAKKEFEHQRTSLKRQLADAANDQRNAVNCLEEQLRETFAELDRLRLEVKGPSPTGHANPANGFADTQIFETLHA